MDDDDYDDDDDDDDDDVENVYGSLCNLVMIIGQHRMMCFSH